jgi:hypothetical protein
MVAVIDILVLGVGWPFLPRGDARFVGKWNEASATAPEEVVAVAVFASDGAFTHSTAGWSETFRYSTTETTLVLETGTTLNNLPRPLRRVANSLGLIRGVSRAEFTYSFGQNTNTLTLRRHGDVDRLLTRLSE